MNREQALDTFAEAVVDGWIAQQETGAPPTPLGAVHNTEAAS